MVRPFRTLKAPGGTIHVHEDGRRVFVRAHPPLTMKVGVGSSSKPRPVPGVRPLTPPRAPAAPRAPSAPTPDAPAQQQVDAAPGFTAAAPVTQTALGSPTDASYLTDLAQIRHRVNTQRQQLDSQGVTDTAKYTESSRRYNEQEPLAQQNANEGYNRQGLLYSGKLGQEKGRLATQYARTRADMLANYTGAQNARAEARRQLEAGATLEEASLAAAATDRQITRDQEAADRNALVSNQEAPAALPPAGAPTPTSSSAGFNPAIAAYQGTPVGPAYRTVPGKDAAGHPGVWHLYANRKVFVRK